MGEKFTIAGFRQVALFFAFGERGVQQCVIYVLLINSLTVILTYLPAFCCLAQRLTTAQVREHHKEWMFLCKLASPAVDASRLLMAA